MAEPKIERECVCHEHNPECICGPDKLGDLENQQVIRIMMILVLVIIGACLLIK